MLLVGAGALLARLDDSAIRDQRTKSMVQRLPNFLLGRVVHFLEHLIYDWQLDLSRFGVEPDQFGSAMVSNIGNFEGFGMSFALAPLVPISRVPIVVLIGQVQRKPVVEDDQVVVRSVVTLFQPLAASSERAVNGRR